MIPRWLEYLWPPKQPARITGVVRIHPLRCRACQQPLLDGEPVFTYADGDMAHLVCPQPLAPQAA